MHRTTDLPARSRPRAAVLVVALMLAATPLACGDRSAPAPRIDGIDTESGAAEPAIGEELTVRGADLVGGDREAWIGGVRATVVAESAAALVLRVPPGAAHGATTLALGDPPLASIPLTIRRLVYTANFSTHTISVLRLGEDPVLTPIGDIPVDVAPGPFAVTFTPDGRRAVAPCSIAFLPQGIVDVLAPGAPAGDFVALIDVIHGRVDGVVSTGAGSKPMAAVVSPDGRFAYVTTYTTSQIVILDLTTNTVVGAIDVPRQPEEIAISGDGTLLLVASDGGTASTVSTTERRVLGTVSTDGNDPSGVALRADAREGYVTNSFTDRSSGEDGALAILDLTDPERPRLARTIAEGIGPTPYEVLAVSGVRAGGVDLLVTNQNVIFDPVTIGPGSVSLVSLGAGAPAITTLAVGSAPIGAALTPDQRFALIGNGLDRTIDVIDLERRIAVQRLTIDATIGPADVAVQP